MANQFIIGATEDGLQFIDALELAFLKELGEVKTHRASHVEPDNFLLRFLFHQLRQKFGEQGCVAQWTRNWKCLWRVNMQPSGGPILTERWINRDSALQEEVRWLEANIL